MSSLCHFYAVGFAGWFVSTKPPSQPRVTPKLNRSGFNLSIWLRSAFGFPGGVGKTWEPGAFEELLGDVTSRVFDVYGDDSADGNG